MKSAFKIKTSLFLITIIAFLLSGCGSNGIDDVYKKSEDSAVTDYIVQVSDDPVLGATIISNECSGFEERIQGFYLLTGCDSKPKIIISSGGYMEINGTKVDMGFPLTVNPNFVKDKKYYTVTPLTTLLSTAEDRKELVQIKDALGFDNVEDMFVDDNNTRELQQTLNTFFIDAGSSGVKDEDFPSFLDDLRANVKKVGKTNNAIETLKKAKEEFGKGDNKKKYRQRYGIVFSGFVTSTTANDTNKSAVELLLASGDKFSKKDNQTIFSGFIFDEVIGKENPLYSENAKIKLTNLDLNVTVAEANATDDGGYSLKFNSSDINASNKYLLTGTITSISGKKIKLNSLLTGKEILGSFTEKLSSKDIPGLVISNVTTAKVILLEKQGIDLKEANVTQIIDAKEKMAKDNKELILDISVALKVIIDGNATIDSNVTDKNNTFDYVKSLIDANTTEGTITLNKADDMNTSFEEFKEEVKNDKTLSEQLEQTTVVQKFEVNASKVIDKELILKVNSESTPRKLFLYKDYSFNFVQYFEDYTSVNHVGDWNITADGDLKLTSTKSDIFTLSFTSLTQPKAQYDQYGNFKGMSVEPKGRVVTNTSNLLFKLVKINDINMEDAPAPKIAFKQADLNNTQFFVVYEENNESKEHYYKFKPNGEGVAYNDFDGAESKNAIYLKQITYTIDNGVLKVYSADYGNKDYRILNSFKSKLKVLDIDSNKEVEFYYENVNASAAKETNNYVSSDNYIDFQAKWDESNISNNNDGYNSFTDVNNTKVFKAVPLENDENNYKESSIKMSLQQDQVDNEETTKIFGTQSLLAVGDNNGDSARQTAGITTVFNLPTCSETSNGSLIVSMLIKYNSVRYTIDRKDTNGNRVSLYDKSVEIVKEKTLKSNYELSALVVKNHVVMQVKNGENAYFAYVPLKSLWNAQKSVLEGFKYPTAYKGSSFFTKLKDENDQEIYKDKSNAAISAELKKFNLITEDSGSYDGGNALCQ